MVVLTLRATSYTLPANPMLLTILIFIIILSILVFVHELGHYMVAKWSGIKVEEFGFGLPPRAWGKKVGETIYSINWLPFGGFVKLFGEDEAGSGRVAGKTSKEPEPADESRAFYNKPLLNRIAVVVAGVIMNLLMAIGLYYIILGAHNFKTEIPLLEVTKTTPAFVGANQNLVSGIVIIEAAPDSPAAAAGVKSGDRIVAVNNAPVTTVDDFKALIEQNRGNVLNFTLLDENREFRTAQMTPRQEPPPGQGVLGIVLGSQVIRSIILDYSSPTHKVFSGAAQTYNIGKYSFEVFGQLIASSFEKRDVKPVAEGVAGPVGIGRIVGSLIDIGGSKAVYALLEFMALLSLNLAVVNILPFPALDGGRLMFLILEGITRRRVSPKIEQAVNTVGMAVLLMLIMLVTFNDIMKLDLRNLGLQNLVK